MYIYDDIVFEETILKGISLTGHELEKVLRIGRFRKQTYARTYGHFVRKQNIHQF